MKTSDSQKLKLGLFVILGTLLLIVAVYLIGQKKEMFQNTLTISAYFQNVNGLKKGNNVRYSGIDVGVVRSIEMENDSIIKINMSIDEKIRPHIKKNAIATIGSDGLVGSKILNILPGQGEAPPIEPGDIIESYSKIRTDELLNTLGVTNENIALLSSDLLVITQRLIKGEGTLGVLLNDTLMARELKQSISNLRVATNKASGVMTDLNGIANELRTDDNSVWGVLMNDTITAEKLRNTIGSLDSLRSDLQTTVQSINTIATDIQNSEGALNYILKDSTLVNELKSTVENINQGTEKFDQNMEALKHNFLFRGYFKKLERQKAKEKTIRN